MFWIDEQVTPISHPPQIARDEGNYCFSQTLVVVIILDDKSRPYFVSRNVCERKTHHDDIAATSHSGSPRC
jgi:hypothetical protein